MGKRETTIKLSVADGFSQNLRAFADQLDASERSTEGLSTSTKEAEDKTKSFASATKQSTNVLTDLQSGISLARQAFAAVQGTIDATIGSTVEYAAQVRTLSRTIGGSAEETSKLIQAADDVGISVDSLSGAMEAAIRKGVRPTIEGLGQLSEEYLAIQDPIERSKFLMDNFGRSGTDLAALMEKGAAGIKKMGDSAKATGQVMSGEAIQAARNYEIAIDELSDRFEGLKISIANKAIPAVTEFTGYLSTRFDALTDAKQALDVGAISAAEFGRVLVSLGMVGFATTTGEAAKLKDTLEDYRVKQYAASHAVTEWRNENDLAKNITAAFAKSVSGLKKETTNLIDEYHTLMSIDIGGMYSDLQQKQMPLIEQQKKLTQEVENYKYANGSAIPPSKDFADIQYELGRAHKQLEIELMKAGKAQGDYNTQVSKGKADNEAFAISQASASLSLEDHRKKISDLEKKQKEAAGGGFADYSEAIKKAKGELGKIDDAIQKNAAEHEKATKKIILNMIEQQLATSALRDKSGAILLDMARSWGLIDEKTYLTSKAITAALESAGMDADKAKEKLAGVADVVDSQLNMKYDELFGKMGVVTDYIQSDNVPALEKLHDRAFDAAGASDGLAKSINSIPKVTRVEIHIDTYQTTHFADSYSTNYPGQTTRTSSGGGGGGMAQFAEGGSFTVPGKGGGDKPYMLGLTPGEEVTVIPPGAARSGGASSGGAQVVNVSINIGGSVISEGELIRNVVNGLRRENIINNGTTLTT